MRIDELDEFQGLTPDMVRAWLANLDPSIKPSACIGGDIEAVSELCGETSQSLLREINPRMREITDGAFRSHSFNGGWWIVEDANGKPMVRRLLVKLFPDDGWLLAKGWPCDKAGNKVRWPTDANGVML